MYCAEKSDPNSNKTVNFGKIQRFFKEKFADSLWHGSLPIIMPKPDKNDASKGLILGHKVLQKCSNFFQVHFGLGLDPKIKLEECLIPTLSLDNFLGSLGHQKSSLREAQPVYYFSMVLN